jgi:hypothetical protein
MISKDNTNKIENLLSLILEEKIYDTDEIYKSFTTYFEYENKISNLILQKNDISDLDNSVKYKENELILINFLEFLLNRKLALPFALNNIFFINNSEKIIIKSLKSNKIFYIQKIIDSYTEFNLKTLNATIIKIEPLLKNNKDFFIFSYLNDMDIFKNFNLILFKIFAKINELNNKDLISIQRFEIFENISINFFRLYNIQYIIQNLKINNDNLEEVDYNIMNILFEINSLFNNKNNIDDELINNFKNKLNNLLSLFYKTFLVDNKLIFKTNLKINIKQILIE